ncbi:uncharacterized protein N7483_002502 [Penicillium malachiteum]|uniref:uncharacterized protein n=1 Tax=Penicillium malachiteum TaxID=1324776 RepID=UPI002547BCB4|nr:uncharacterized protein N7483_002502 [Penicillium malachiteum]KAJ5737377.1 hypothetical protein N7483_002502 [Penicillium malachiteum]
MPQGENKRVTHFDIPRDKSLDDQHLPTGTKGIHLDQNRIRLERELKRDNGPSTLSRKRKETSNDDTFTGIVKAHKKTGISTRTESPWIYFKKLYKCDLAGEMTVVVDKSKPGELYFLTSFSVNKLDKLSELLHRLIFTQHENIASAMTCFVTKDGSSTIADFYPLTLGNIVACQHYPDEEQLSAILAQVEK